jgi:hypothetical protein
MRTVSVFDPLIMLFLLIALAATGAILIAFVALYGVYIDYKRDSFDNSTVLASTLLMIVACIAWVLTQWLFVQWIDMVNVRMMV